MKSPEKPAKSPKSSKPTGAEATCDPKMLAEKVKSLLPKDYAETKPMFGGVVFMRRGNMLCCAARNGLMVRVGAEAEARALQSKHASRCLGAGREIPGFVVIEPAGIARDEDMSVWLQMARDYVEPMPEKTANTKARTTAKASR